MAKKPEIESLDELMPEKVTANGLIYWDSLFDPTGPRTHEYALKKAQDAYTAEQNGLSAPATSRLKH